MGTEIVKPARLHFARTARALTGRYMCERGDLSEFLAARTCASCWLDKDRDYLEIEFRDYRTSVETEIT